MQPLFRLLRGSYLGPVHQSIRRADGVRGVFASRPLARGDLVLSVPREYGYLPHAWSTRFHWEAQQSDQDVSSSVSLWRLQQLRRCNRGAALLPEFNTWFRRLSPDTATERVSLSASVTCGASSVTSVHVSPIEAAVAVSVALRQFFGPALGLPPIVAARLRAIPQLAVAELPTLREESRADRYIGMLPMSLCMAHGVESLFTSASAGDDATHACLEQITANLRDACLAFASTEQYRFYDDNPSVLDAVLLTALYIVRARVLTVRLLAPAGARCDSETSVLAPGLDLLNHADSLRCTAVAAVSADRRHVVVRAACDLRRHEEITINYGVSAVGGNLAASPYLLGENHMALTSQVAQPYTWEE